MIRTLLACLLFVGLLFSCTPPPSPASFDTDVNKDFFYIKPFLNAVGSGEIALSVDGQRFNGNFDFKSQDANTVSMEVYSPFGGVLASIKTDSVSGTILIQNKEYSIFLDQLIDTLPFAKGQKLSFRQFIGYLRGQIATMECLQYKPDRVLVQRGKILLSWENDSMVIDAKIRKKDSKIYFFEMKHKNSTAIVRFYNFKNQIARSISLIADDRNYFLINYESMKVN